MLRSLIIMPLGFFSSMGCVSSSVSSGNATSNDDVQDPQQYTPAGVPVNRYSISPHTPVLQELNQHSPSCDPGPSISSSDAPLVPGQLLGPAAQVADPMSRASSVTAVDETDMYSLISSATKHDEYAKPFFVDMWRTKVRIDIQVRHLYLLIQGQQCAS